MAQGKDDLLFGAFSLLHGTCAVVYGNPAMFKGFMSECALPIPVQDGRYTCACGLSYLVDAGKVTRSP